MQIKKLENGQAEIDVRELVNNGGHPKDDILQYLSSIPKGTITKIHVPHEAEPLVHLMKTYQVDVAREKLGEGHFCLHTIKR
ncbi:hypothetical protein [Salipaludibacillus aurantiacus]|uniref:TusA-related sulfurtransferase n=1 Tax=Salipaludibacillus aurantiacus TaxID=1601833 RepID=A0A1H9WAD2_9BACI|nr:hypothetical protein [Salipaludibacillus aurantiacus]SES30731.1 hypothetical protein SAMN05518684_11577 [Salipaludibacillus aurantiacus]